jgi:hypothetical protein
MIQREYLNQINLLVDLLPINHHLFCYRLGLYLSTNVSEPVYILKNCVFKIFIRGMPRRQYIGFLCTNCKAIYYSPDFDRAKWAIRERRTINPIKP